MSFLSPKLQQCQNTAWTECVNIRSKKLVNKYLKWLMPQENSQEKCVNILPMNIVHYCLYCSCVLICTRIFFLTVSYAFIHALFVTFGKIKICILLVYAYAFCGLTPNYFAHCFFIITSCAGGRHNMLPPCKQIDLWRFDLESGVQVTCDVAYLYANFSLPRSLCSRVRPDVRDRQSDRRQTRIIV